MADTTIKVGSSGISKKIVDLGDGTYADAVVNAAPGLSTEQVLAAATGSDDGLGKIATLVNAETIYVRCAADPSRNISWRVKSDKTYTVQKYKARTNVTSATLTMAAGTRVDDTDTFTLQGLTYTAESTQADAAWASRKWKCGGASEETDAGALSALINADYAIVPDGSVAVADTIVVVADGTTYTYTAAAAPDYPNRVFDQSGNQAAELASIVLAINHKDNVTLASVSVNDTVTINNGINSYTFTAKASETVASRQFSQAGTNTEDGDSLVTCVNDATYGVPGITASNSSGVVSFTRNSSAYSCTVTSSNGTRLAVATAGGVPGVIAAATGATGELAVTPTWAASLTITASPVTHITVTDIDCPGIISTAPGGGVVTLASGTVGMPTGGDLAPVIQFGQGTSDANEIAFADTTLASLIIDGSATVDAAANSSTAGTLYEQTMNGWEYGYIGVTNKSGGDAATIVVAATVS